MRVAFAADSEAVAEEAIRLIEVAWGVRPFVYLQEDPLKEREPVVHPEINPEGNILPNAPRGNGERSDNYYMIERIVEITTHYLNSNQVTLDSMGCLISGRMIRLTCWTNNFADDQCGMHLSKMMVFDMYHAFRLPFG